MKQQVRKILSLTTAAALTLGMVVTAHAADSGMTRGEMAKLLVEGAGPVSYTHLDVYKRQVEYQANEFTLGVQFHPEADALTDAAFAAYFNTLLKYAA